jgi:hypothetical protein
LNQNKKDLIQAMAKWVIESKYLETEEGFFKLQMLAHLTGADNCIEQIHQLADGTHPDFKE